MEIFKYDQLDYSGHDFRLVRLVAGAGINIECGLIHATLDDDDIIPYEAVSYTWGSSVETEIIYLDGTPKPVRQNLYLILRDLRFPEEDRLLWVDAICIDQDDKDERNHQVRQMGGIYNRAVRVLFCIGRPTEMTHIVMTSLKELQKKCRDSSWTREDKRWEVTWRGVQTNLMNSHFDFQSRLRQGLQHMLKERWFRRVWILQEVANARAAWVYCGPQHVPARTFALIPRLVDVTPDSHCQAVLDMIPMKKRTESDWSQGQDLYCLLKKFAKAEAEDDRDKIYALCGMCTSGKERRFLTIDYRKSVSDVIRETIALMCFCSPESVPQHLCFTMQSFLSRLDSVHHIMIEEFIKLGQKKSLKLLLKQRQYVSVTPRIAEAVVRNEANGKEMLEILLSERKEEVDITTDLLQIAAGNLEQRNELFDLFLQKAGNNSFVERPLLWAVMQGSNSIVRLLLEKGVNFEAKNYSGQTPLLLAAEEGHDDIVRLLLEKGADLGVETEGGFTPLFYAARNRHNAVVRLLLENGADFEATDCFGQTPLLWAVKNGHSTTVRLLLEKGANLEIKDYDGRTPLLLAAKNGHDTIVRLLLGKGANYEAKDECGLTSLLYAARKGHHVTVHLLLEKGADLEVVTEGGFTPLFYAAINGYDNIVRLLLDKGADLEAKDNFGKTPLSWASTYRRDTTVRLLLEKGFSRG